MAARSRSMVAAYVSLSGPGRAFTRRYRLRVAESVSYAKPRIPLVSNVTGKVEGERFASADYWVEHVLAPVRMHDGLRTILASHEVELVEWPDARILADVDTPEDLARWKSLAGEELH